MNIAKIVELYNTDTCENCIAAYSAIYTSDRLDAFAEKNDFTASEMCEWLASLLITDKTSREEEWGSEKQIDAQNKFFELVEEITSDDEFFIIEDYALKATTEEMQDYALEIINK